MHAEHEARAALNLSAENSARRVKARAILARVLLARGSHEEALSQASQAITSMHELEHDDEAQVCLIHAEALHANGEHDRAREAILAARDRLLERANKIDVPEWRHSFLHSVPDHARTLELAETWA